MRDRNKNHEHKLWATDFWISSITEFEFEKEDIMKKRGEDLRMLPVKITGPW